MRTISPKLVLVLAPLPLLLLDVLVTRLFLLDSQLVEMVVSVLIVPLPFVVGFFLGYSAPALWHLAAVLALSLEGPKLFLELVRTRSNLVVIGAACVLLLGGMVLVGSLAGSVARRRSTSP